MERFLSGGRSSDNRPSLDDRNRKDQTFHNHGAAEIPLRASVHSTRSPSVGRICDASLVDSVSDTGGEASTPMVSPGTIAPSTGDRPVVDPENVGGLHDGSTAAPENVGGLHGGSTAAGLHDGSTAADHGGVQAHDTDDHSVSPGKPPASTLRGKRKNAAFPAVESKRAAATAEDSDSDDDELNSCMICTEKWTNQGKHRLVATKCGHLFGRSCIENWHDTKKKEGVKPLCPSCRQPISKSDLRIIQGHHYTSARDATEVEGLKTENKRLNDKIGELEIKLMVMSEMSARQTQKMAELKTTVASGSASVAPQASDRLGDTGGPAVSTPCSTSGSSDAREIPEFKFEFVSTANSAASGSLHKRSVFAGVECHKIYYHAAHNTLLISAKKPVDPKDFFNTKKYQYGIVFCHLGTGKKTSSSIPIHD